MKVLLLVLVLSFKIPILFAQSPAKRVTHKNYMWYGYLFQARNTERWGSWFDFHLRTENLNLNSFWIVRVGVIYRNKLGTMFVGGYANLHSFENINRIDRNEHRIWQQVQWVNTYPRMRIMHRFRFEQRYRQKMLNGEIVPGYNFNHRLRYMLNISVSLNNKKPNQPKSLVGVLQNELLMNAGKEIIYNYLDQNRLFVGVGFQITPTIHFQVGYMHTFLQQPAPSSYVESNTARFFLFHQIDLRKKENKSKDS
ncbi:MAG: DUF2490 domain-containing protein [Cytophagales bacterium]|nr:DUF2490 domain-containing protein [Cytophagales bacterium]MDW8383615.1 DUF2490 domain-containing protein [Flammeovirgaceae bacterium]